MTLHIQSFLRAGGTFAELTERFAIKHRRHGLHPELVLFKYDQIESPFAEPLVRECRGIILNEREDWRVVSRAFDKFFNHGEGLAADVDWSTARTYEKVDGSLCVLYAYAGAWHVATTGTPDASGRVGPMQLKFAELFWRTYAKYADAPPLGHDGRCYFFELTSPHNRVVVPHQDDRLTLLGARHEDGHEVSLDVAREWLGSRFGAARSFDLSSHGGIVETFAELNPLHNEGYVVVDSAFKRIKVKHPGYVALHHAKDGMSVRAFVDIARSGEVSEVVVAFPEFAAEVAAIQSKFCALVAEVEADYAAIERTETQKNFALMALKSRCSAALFNVRAKKSASVREFLRTVHVDRIVEMLSLKTETKEAA